VSASIQTLCDPAMQLEEDIRLALERLPPTLQGVYAIIIAQIHNGAPVSMPLAKKALKWLLCAQQPLSSNEFLKALSADLGVSNAKITVENLLNICCNLVKYDSELDVVRFIHLSVREYLETKEPEYEPSLSHSAVATACLQACFHGAKPKRKRRLKNARNKTFYDYAIVYWPLHCVQAGAYRRQEKLGKLFYDFIYDKKTYPGWLWSFPESWEEMGLETRGDSPDVKLFEQLTDCRSRWRSPIFLACAFGFIELFQDGRELQEKDGKKENDSRRDPFHTAVRNGQRDVVEHLARSPGQEGADEGSLIAAVSMSNKIMVSYLLEKNPQLSITQRVIDAGVSNADVDTVEFLITKVDRVEVTTGLINLAAANGLGGKQIIDLLLNLGQDASIADQTIELACSNHKHGLAILESLLLRRMDSSITEEAVECAAANSKCGFALLNTLFHRASHLEVTTAMIEAACRNSTLEPLQFLLSKNKAVSISYDSLAIASSNEEVGDQMLVLLLERCKPTLLDEWLLLSAMRNRKLGVELTKLLFAKAGGTILPVTMDLLEAAAENRYIGETLIEEFLKDPKAWKLCPGVATAAARNRYSPVEVLTFILKTDEGLKITMDTIIAAAENPQYALELLDSILLHDPNIKITPEVIKAAATNEQSGANVIHFLWHLGPFPITPAAFEAAAQNRLCGDKILSIWLKNKSVDIPPVAVEAAMTNSSLGPEILRFLLQTGRVEISSKAVEHAAANEMYGPTLITSIIRHQGKIEVTEELLASAAVNAVTGSEVLEILLNHGGSARVTPFVIETAASKWNFDNMTTLLSAAQPLSVTSQAVRYALQRGGKAITVLKCFLEKNPALFLGPEISEAIIEYSREADVVEIFEFLGKCGKEVQISEMMTKQAVQRSMILLLVLAEHCERRQETMPITQEVIEASIKRQGIDAPAMLEYLLQKLLDRGEKMKMSESLVATAVGTHWAEKTLEILSEFNGGIIPTSSTVIQLAVVNPKLSNSIIEKFLGISPRHLRDLRSTEATIIAAVERLSPKALKKWLLSLQQPIQITQNIMETAGRYVDNLALILDILQIQGQESLIPSLLSQRVFQVAKFPQLKLLRRKLRECGQQMPITSGVMMNTWPGGPGLELPVLKHITTILREQGQESELPKLITDEVVLEAVKSRSSVRVLTFLKDTLGTERFCGILSEAHVMTAAGAGNIDCVNFLYPLIASLQPKQYYEDIVAFSDAVSKCRPADLRKLLARKVFPNARNRSGEPPLSFVIRCGDLITFHLMLEYPEVNLNSTNVDGRTPLFIAAARGKTIFVKPLLSRGVDRSIKDKDGKTAEDIAVEAGNYMIASLIRDFGTMQQEEIASKDEPPTARMERFSLVNSMTL
jgi:ankyrin repeat protein